MKIPSATHSDWPESWRISHLYDVLELGERPQAWRLGYSYAWRNRQDKTTALVQCVAAPPAGILDVAAAQGNLSLRLAELGYVVTWNDLREELADYVRLKWEKGTVEYAPGNAFEIKFPELFEVVVATEIIEHVAHPDQFVAQMAALVKPGGHLVLTTPNGEYFLNRLPKFSDCDDPGQFESLQFQPNSDGHIFLLHLSELNSQAEMAGLEVVRGELLNNPLTCGHRKTEWLLKILPSSWVRAIERWSSKGTGWTCRRYHYHLAAVFRKPLHSASRLGP